MAFSNYDYSEECLARSFTLIVAVLNSFHLYQFFRHILIISKATSLMDHYRFCTTGLPSDIVVEIGEMSFHLHKVIFQILNLIPAIIFY